MSKSNYKNLFIMVGFSTLCMYPLMYLNTYIFDHIFFSQTRVYMTLIMGSFMMLVMLFFMRHMYQDRKTNLLIILASSAVFLSSLILVRSQATVGDIAWMRAMIPHHSIAILTSERAKINDPRVKKLASDIIEAQKKEIIEMKKYIKDLK